MNLTEKELARERELEREAERKRIQGNWPPSAAIVKHERYHKNKWGIVPVRNGNKLEETCNVCGHVLKTWEL